MVDFDKELDFRTYLDPSCKAMIDYFIGQNK